ncbi:hypothetical protein BBD41_13310 [Paenibacillus ihbetae]|uniref:Uncharacterized protein n=1 Tax=Paenibacillus ihbetae TaxID=1870820 RepID=A0A1B2E0K1_9BACL|nr:hypothetical protein [Paenibacillus ihbetae]ANY73483.1 hypothetical protein BBD41_13310 [Paenibacillus ihbetae]
MNAAAILMRYAKPMKWSLLGIIMLMMVENAAGMLMTAAQKFIIDDLFMHGKYHLFLPIILLYLCRVQFPECRRFAIPAVG